MLPEVVDFGLPDTWGEGGLGADMFYSPRVWTDPGPPVSLTWTDQTFDQSHGPDTMSRLSG